MGYEETLDFLAEGFEKLFREAYEKTGHDFGLVDVASEKALDLVAGKIMEEIYK